jgi:hypothetical protein
VTIPAAAAHVVLGLTVTIPDQAVELNLGYLPWLLGDSLAAQVDGEVRRARLGYYPAVDFFRRPASGVDPALLPLLDEVARFAVEYARRELRRTLARAFPLFRIPQARCTAYTLPRARPGRPQSVAELGKHYAPSRVKLELILGPVDKIPMCRPEEQVRSQVEQWASGAFVRLEINRAALVEADGGR